MSISRLFRRVNGVNCVVLGCELVGLFWKMYCEVFVSE